MESKGRSVSFIAKFTPDRLASQLAHVAAMRPRHHMSDLITNDLPAFRQGKAWKRFAVCILDFDSHKTRIRRRVVYLQSIGGEAKWFRDHSASSVRSIDRDKPGPVPPTAL
ncbi:MAG: hypothetical protein VX435_01285 [Planctomycetota bacterium]|nr:hypothetical protein [Planctomycetota bacterium]